MPLLWWWWCKIRGDIDLSHRRKISGVGHIGNERGRGFFVQTVLAVRPQSREVLGCMAKATRMSRIPAPDGEQRHQRRKREERESDVWMRQVHAIGTPESASMWVLVGDPRADMFAFFQAGQATRDALSGTCGEVTTRRGVRGRDQLFADAGTGLSQPSESSVRDSCSAWSSCAFDPVAACLWSDDALATAKCPTSEQGAFDRVGHPRLGRESSRGRGATGMDEASLGAHHHARRGVGARGLVSASLAGRGLSPMPHKRLSH